MTLTAAWTRLRPHEKQIALWQCPKRFVAVPAGRGSGKTELAKRRLVRYLPVKKPWPDPRYFYAAPTSIQAVMIAWQSILSLIPPQWVSNINLTNRRIITIFGSELRIIGMDKPQRIEGLQWDGCVLDESCDLKPKVFDLNILPMLLHRNGWCWRIGVPKRQGPGAYEYRQFYEKAITGQIDDAAGFSWPSSDILPPDVIADARARMDAKDFREQLEAKFETAGGQIFYAFDEERSVRSCSYDPQIPIIIGSDFNVDPMAWIIGHRFDGRMEWFDEIFKRNTNTEECLNILWARYGTHRGGFEFYGDATSSARKTSASLSDYKQILSDPRFIEAGRTVHYSNSNPPRRDRFAACNAMFRNAAGSYRMHIDLCCENLINDLKSRYTAPGSSDPEDSGDLGHMTDAMGYAVYSLFPIQVPISTELSQIHMTKG